MYFFIGSSSSGPFNSFQVFHIGFQDEPLFIKNFMQNVLNSVVSIPLILKPLKRLSVVAEIQGDLGLQAFLHWSTIIMGNKPERRGRASWGRGRQYRKSKVADADFKWIIFSNNEVLYFWHWWKAILEGFVLIGSYSQDSQLTPAIGWFADTSTASSFSPKFTSISQPGVRASPCVRLWPRQVVVGAQERRKKWGESVKMILAISTARTWSRNYRRWTWEWGRGAMTDPLIDSMNSPGRHIHH